MNLEHADWKNGTSELQEVIAASTNASTAVDDWADQFRLLHRADISGGHDKSREIAARQFFGDLEGTLAPSARCEDLRDVITRQLADGLGQIWFAGIPARDDFRRLQRVLRDVGANVAISQDRGSPINAGVEPE